ncbi:MAG: hypothetical protein QXS19_00080 [Candidatus Methanomethylicia archaeon]
MYLKHLRILLISYLFMSLVPILVYSTSLININEIGEYKLPIEIHYFNEVDESKINIALTELAWRLIVSESYKNLFDRSDLIAIIEIDKQLISYYVREYEYIFTLYKARVVKVIKGSIESDEIWLYQIGGYNPKWDRFIHLDVLPLFKPGEKWLLFMGKIIYDPTTERLSRDPASKIKPILLLSNTYDSNGLFALKVVNDKLYSWDYWSEYVKNLSEEARKKLWPEHLRVWGVSVEEFVKNLEG